MLEVEQAAAALQWGLLEQQPEGRIHQLPAREDAENIDCLQFLFSILSREQHNKQWVWDAFSYSSCAVWCKVCRECGQREIFHASSTSLPGLLAFVGFRIKSVLRAKSTYGFHVFLILFAYLGSPRDGRLYDTGSHPQTRGDGFVLET